MQSALASSVEPVLWNAPAGPLHHCFRAPEAVQSQCLPFLISLWDTHLLQLLEHVFCLLALKTFVFCQDLFSGVWLWHCSKAFNKHLNSFPGDKNHGHSSSCLVAAWHFPKRLWDSLLAFLF